jgi:hypothetical protein
LVAGHAYGNRVARMLASDRPDLVRGVVRRHAVMSSTLSANQAESLEPTSENVNPPHMIGFTESMYESPSRASVNRR